MTIRYKLGVIFIAIQIISIIVARFIPERFFCWAPYDEHTYISVNVKIDGKQLSKAEVLNRYRYKYKGWEPRSIDNVFNIIKQYETTYGQEDHATVLVTYSTNGKEERIWSLKQ